MEKKRILKWVLIGCGVILVIFLIAMLFRKNPGEEVVSSKPLNEEVNLEQVFDEIKKIDGMQIQKFEEIDEEGKVQNSENELIIAEEEIEFGKYDVLERKAIVHTNDENINEVWMVKLSDMNQQENICRIFGNRIQKLRNGFDGNESALNVINNAVVKQEGAIIIMIASPKVYEIEKTIAEAMK